jgi:hypothetical protein
MGQGAADGFQHFEDVQFPTCRVFPSGSTYFGVSLSAAQDRFRSTAQISPLHQQGIGQE